MWTLPPIPSWDGLHPLILHFPIALLLVSPVFLVLGLVIPRQRQAWFLAGFLLMAMGTVAAWITVPTGKAAGELAERTPGVGPVLERHEELGELTRNVFTVLVVLYAGVFWISRVLAPRRRAPLLLQGAFLVLYAAGLLVLVNTAHVGGRLVHEFGLRAMIGSSPADGSTAPAASGEEDHDRD